MALSALLTPSRTALWRYNYKILIGGGFWIIVLPVAASQIVTLWMMALSHDFSELAGTAIAELMAPILGAFLVAHAMAPEYRSGIGSVLACKPVSLWRVVALRVGLALLVAEVLTLVTLVVNAVSLHMIDLGPPVLASLPSLWFLSMVALTLSTLFRSSFAGFAGAAALWVLDLQLGYAANPLFSLQGLTAKIDSHPLSVMWLAGKGFLLVAGFLLLAWQGKLVGRLGRAADRTDLTRVAVAIASMLAIYIVSGAVTTVGYAYLHRTTLPTREATWLRRQMGIYGPIPVPRLFGPAFALLASQPVPTHEGEKESPQAARIRQLRSGLRRWPQSMWAPSLANTLAQEEELIDPAGAVRDYFAVAQAYPRSPHAPRALSTIILLEGNATDDEQRLRAARLLVAEHPDTEDVDKAAALMARLAAGPEQLGKQSGPRVDPGELLAAATAASKAAPAPRRPLWMVTAAKVLAQEGRRSEAEALATQARDTAQRLLDEDMRVPASVSSLGRYRADLRHAQETAAEILAGK